MILFFCKVYVHLAFSKVEKMLQKRSERDFCSICEGEKEKKISRENEKKAKAYIILGFLVWK